MSTSGERWRPSNPWHLLAALHVIRAFCPRATAGMKICEFGF